MKERLSRKRTQVSIVLIVVGCLLVLIGVILDFKPCMFSGVLLMIAALLTLQRKCPYCGRYCKATPQWSAPGTYHCPHCGKRLAYDDEPEELDDPQLSENDSAR